MGTDITLRDVEARRTAVIAATTTWTEFPRLWKEMLDEVWACLRASGIRGGCPNVMVYGDDVPNVEVGVLLSQPCELTGRVQESSLPGGRVSAKRHVGSYSKLGETHGAIVAWCREHGLELAGPRWEIYGPHRESPSEMWTDVEYLLLGKARN